jgi:hypothetical protein
MPSQLDIFTSLDVAASIDPVIVSADPEVRRSSISALQVRDAAGAAGSFRFVVDTVNKRLGFSEISGTFAPGVVFHSEVEGQDNLWFLDVYSNGADDEPEIAGRRARGTKAAPLAVLAGDDLYDYEAHGWDGAVFGQGNGDASIVFTADENFAVGAHGTRTEFWNTNIGSGVRSRKALLQSDGDFDIEVGGLEIGNVQVFEADRDLAINLIPNADISLTLGSASRRFTQAVANQFDVFLAAGDANPTGRLSDQNLLFGAGGASAPDLRYRRGGVGLGIFDDNGSTDRTWIIDGANVRVGMSSIDDVFVPAFSFHAERQGSDYEMVCDNYGGNFTIIGRAANGTKAAPTALGDDGDMLEVVGRGYDGVAFSGNQGSMLLEADGAWTGASHGTKWTLRTTPSGSLIQQDSVEVRGAGAVNISVGEFEMGGVDVFEADRDLAINLIPNADGALNVGSSARRFAKGFFQVLNHYRYEFYGDQFENPNNADWVVNALAPASADSLNAGLTVRRFDDTIEEGAGFTLTVPADAIAMRFTFRHRAQTAPGGAVTTQPRLYRRTRADNAAWGAWSAAFAYVALSLPATTDWQDDVEVVTLATLGLTAGQVAQFELTRDPADGLTGDWVLHELMVEFL